MSIDVNPYTALVICPLVVASEVGRAKKARKERLCPSRRKIRLGRSASSGMACLGFLDAWVFGAATTPIVDSGSDRPAVVGNPTCQVDFLSVIQVMPATPCLSDS